MIHISASAARKWTATVVAGAFALFATAIIVTANLTGSTFEGGDGNLTANSAGNTDWANVASLNIGVDNPSGTNDNSFGQGTKEDNAAVSVVTGSIPPNKSDLTRFYEASEFTNGSTYLYLAWERTNVLGSANMDFEINQASTAGLGTPGAHTVNRTAGDLLVTYDFTNGGTNPVLGLLFWVTSGSTGQCFSSNSLPCWGKHLSLNSTNSEGAINSATVTDPIGGTSLQGLTFGETAINLSGAGVFAPGVCEAFGSAFLKSRSSASFTAEVKDFVAPIPVNISNCGTIAIHKVTENGDSLFGYSTSGALSPAAFNLSNGGTQSYTKVAVGSYSVTEQTPPAGWSLKSLVCTATGSNTLASTSGATATITMGAGGNVDCTYTNHINANPSITTSLSATTVNTGTPVHDSATLTGALASAGGTVSYSVYSDNTCQTSVASGGTKTVSGGVVPDSDPVTLNTAGIYYWQAAYSGDANDNPTTSTCTSEQLIVKTNPTVATTLSATSVAIGSTVHDSATLSGATADATGTVTYSVYTNSTCSAGVQSAGTKIVSSGSVPDSDGLQFNNAGTFYWQAVYSGDAKNNGATSACTSEQLVVNPNQPGIVTAPNLIPNDTATISGATSTAGGTITFSLYGPADATCSGTAAYTQTVTVSGNGTYTTTNTTFVASTLGTWRWQVTYSGDSNNTSTSSACGVESFTIANGS